MKPERFGPYLLVDRLGGASLSEVFLALRVGDADGAIHVLKRPALDAKPSDEVSEAIRREAEVLARVSHPVLPKLVDSGTLAGLPYVVLEYVTGHALSRFLERGAQPEGVVRVVGANLLRGLRALHEAGWVHGDVSPANIIVDELGEIRLIDLGLAVGIDAPRSHPAGTPGYASPRAALGKPLTPFDDLYSAAIVLAELQLGERLYAEDALADSLRRPLFSENPKAKRIATSVAAILSSYNELSVDLGSTLEAFEASISPADRAMFSDFARGGVVRVERATVAPSVEARPPFEPTARFDSGIRSAVDHATGRSVVTEPPRDVPTPASSRIGKIAIVVAIVAALVVGIFIGRRAQNTARAQHDQRDGSITLPMMPARTEVKIDGETVLVPEAGRPIPIKAGKHTITFDPARGDTREYTIVVEPGDKVLVVTIGKGAR